MSILYLDMDGVITDFNKRYRERFNQGPNEVKGRFIDSPQWKQFVDEEHFATLDWFPGGKVLLEYLKGIDIHIEILSSSGGDAFYEQITEQKTRWLRNNGIHFPVNIVPGKRHKKTFARLDRILVDDTEKNVVEFIGSGGMAVHHVNVPDTISTLEFVL